MNEEQFWSILDLFLKECILWFELLPKVNQKGVFGVGAKGIS